MEFITTNLEILIVILLSLLAVFGVGAAAWKVVSKTSDTFSGVFEKVTSGLMAGAAVTQSFGLDRGSLVLKELADVTREIDDFADFLAEKTSDGEFTKEEALKVLEEGKDIIVEGKDFRLKVIKKK